MSPADSTVLFRALPIEFRLTSVEKRMLNSFASVLKQEVGGERDFTCLITNDRELRRLNKMFLGQDYATDVLSFPAHEGSSALGELAISIQQADLQAREFGHGRLEELCVLMLHGVLHLTGLDHESDSGEMRHNEEHFRRVLGLPSSLIDRAEIRIP